jgi:hypothetical protein
MLEPAIQWAIRVASQKAFNEERKMEIYSFLVECYTAELSTHKTKGCEIIHR